MDRGRKYRDGLPTDHGYYLRSTEKRRKFSEQVLPENHPAYKWTRSNKRKNPIMHMPTEVLQNIFKYISFKDLANIVRLVNRRFKVIAENALNNEFLRLEQHLKCLKKVTFESLQATQGDMETKCMCKLLNILEIITFYHSTTKSTIWRHVYNKQVHSKLCFYAGYILDLYKKILYWFLHSPEKIYGASLLKDYTLSIEVESLCQLTKKFNIYFDRVSEYVLNNSPLCSGCKILDMLDCATYATKQVLSQKVVGNTFTTELEYYFKNAWFVALDMNESKPKEWSEQQRLMYMRIRRIVVGHTEMHMEYAQYEREIMIRQNPFNRLKKPINSVYTGYGEVGTKFFYYGVMNEGTWAYFQKFEAHGPAVDLFEEEAEQAGENNESSDATFRVPFLGLHISIRVKCPLQLAPYEFVKKHESGLNELTSSPSRRKNKPRGVFDMTIDFDCYSAQYPRLPTHFNLHIKNTK